MANPFSKLSGIWNSSREKDVVDIIRKQNDSFFPHHTTLWKKQIDPAFQRHCTDKNLKLSSPELKKQERRPLYTGCFWPDPSWQLLPCAPWFIQQRADQTTLHKDPWNRSWEGQLQAAPFKQPNEIHTTEEIPSPSHFGKQNLMACRK